MVQVYITATFQYVLPYFGCYVYSIIKSFTYIANALNLN